jgi:CheY-like chemotaxis protein
MHIEACASLAGSALSTLICGHTPLEETRMKPSACILVVEDERLIALDLQRRLHRLGYGVTGLATSGTEAITQALARRPDLVLMDIRLEGAMDGLEVAQFLRTHLNLPALFVTGVTDAATMARADPAVVLRKPVEDAVLEAALTRLLTKGHSKAAFPVTEGTSECRCADLIGDLARGAPSGIAQRYLQKRTECQPLGS